MQEGIEVYYSIQHKQTHESPWMKPKGKLRKAEDKNWAFSNMDVFGRFKIEGETIYSNKYKSLDLAKKVIKKIRANDLKGEYDNDILSHDKYQAVRHKFRIVQCFECFKIIEVKE